MTGSEADSAALRGLPLFDASGRFYTERVHAGLQQAPDKHAGQIAVAAVIAGGMRTPFLLDRFSDIDLETLQDPRNVADTVKYVISQPEGTVIPEVMVLPMRESSWP